MFDHFFPQYWIDKGYTEADAIEKVNSRKNKASTNSNKVQALSGDTKPTQLQYWIKKGYSEEDAKIKLSERQTTFSLEKCIEKFGVEDGYNRWLERQQKWMSTLNSKTPEELGIINKKKTKNSKGGVSKQEKLLYSMMNDSRITAQFTVGKYAYDFGCGYNIVEYNGDFWHCNPKLFKEDAMVYTKTAKQIWECDEQKKQYAIDNGYKVLVVWESDFIKNKEAVVDRCKQFLLS